MLDQYKTGTVQLCDIRRLAEDDEVTTKGSSSTAGSSSSPSLAFDWKQNAIQQIGLVISKLFPSIEECFEQVSERLNTVSVEQFRVFVEKCRALSGFNLTFQLLQELFSDIDPHKKGYLTQ